MTIESANTFAQLNPTLPAPTDPLAEGANHIRLLKTLLATIFPNLATAITASDVDLNALPSLRTSFSTLQADAVITNPTTLTQTVTGGLSAAATTAAAANAVNNPGISSDGSGIVNAAIKVWENGAPLVPRGIISMWSGSAANIPAGYVLCNGQNGTPDLRSQFIIGAGTTTDIFQPGQVGGSPYVTATTTPAGLHNHTGATGYGGGFTLAGTTDTQGAHSHGGQTAAYALTPNDLPAHDHGLNGNGAGAVMTNGGGTIPKGGGGGSGFMGTESIQSVGGNNAHSHSITTDGAHAHNLVAAPVPAHQHTVSSDGNHSHTVTVPIAPPYYALCFVMKT